MRCLLCVLALALPAAAEPASPGLGQVRNVYLLPMGNGLDQYLANHLTNRSLFQVVADPLQADAVFTDRLGQPLEARLSELDRVEIEKARVEELKAKPPSEKKKEKEKDEGDEKAEKKPESEQSMPRVSSFARGKGTIFLVDRKSRRVLWSVYEAQRGSTPADLNRTAERVAARLKQALEGK